MRLIRRLDVASAMLLMLCSTAMATELIPVVNQLLTKTEGMSPCGKTGGFC